MFPGIATVLALVTAVLGVGIAAQSVDDEVRKKLAAPPIFLDETHQGPRMVPTGLPKGVFPLDCGATQAHLHRTQPGAYHFARAQRLLGQGIDVIGCEADGLDRFRQGDDESRLLRVAEQAVLEAEAAAAVPIGTEQWIPGALQHVLTSAYTEAASANRAYGRAHRSPAHTARARELTARRDRVKTRVAAVDVSFRDSPLMTAVRSNDVDRAAALIAAGADVNATDADHTSALRLATATGRTAMVKRLLASGAVPDAEDENGVTALMEACALGQLDIATALLDAGARLNGRAHDGSTPLFAAASHVVPPQHHGHERKLRLVEHLIARGADVNATDWAGRSPLMVAAERDPALVEPLLQAGAAVSARAADGKTPLIAAVTATQVTTVQALLCRQAAVDVMDATGLTALMFAVIQGFPEGETLTRLLLEAGADPNLASPKTGWTPLMAAQQFHYRGTPGVSSRAIVRQLLAAGARVNARTRDGRTALVVAARHFVADAQDASLVVQLLEAGADVDAADQEGVTPLMTAAQHGGVSRVQALLDRGARVDLRDRHGRTALEYTRLGHGDREPGPFCWDWFEGSCLATRRVLERAGQSARP